MNYVQITEDQRQAMLKTIGVATADDLYANLPQAYRLKQPLALTGLDFVTSVSGAATAIANVGPGLGETIGPDGNFASLNPAAKWILLTAMLVGRLELLVVFVLFTARFWQA